MCQSGRPVTVVDEATAPLKLTHDGVRERLDHVVTWPSETTAPLKLAVGKGRLLVVTVVDEATAPLKQLGASVIRSAQCCRQRYAQVTVEDEATAPLKHVLVGFEREDPEVTMALEPMAALKHGALELITQDHRAVTHGAKSWHH